MKKVAIYTRKSIATENSESIETQINLCKSYFNDKDLEFEIFEDEGFSGKNTNRPAFKRLLLECGMGKFDTLICYRLDRISRNVADFSSTLELLQKHNVNFVSIKEQFDTSTPMGRAMIYIASVFAQLERETIAERVRDNMLSLAKKGCFTGGTIPLGCEVVKKEGKSYININDADLVNLYYDAYIEEGSLFLGYKKLKSLGSSLSREGYRKILRNPMYVKSSEEVNSYLQSRGFEVLGTANNINGYMTYNKIINTPIAVIGVHKGVIDADKWLKAQLALDDRKDMFKNKSDTNFLSGILKCPYCGGYYHLAQASGIKYFVCQNRINRTVLGVDIEKEKCKNKKYIRVEKVESKIISLIEMLKDKDIFNNFFDIKLSPNDEELKKLEKQLSKNEKLINNLVDKTMLLSNEAAKPFLSKVEELTKSNQEIKFRIENEKIIKIHQEANNNSLEFIYDVVKRFDSLQSAKEKNNSLKLIFGSLEYDSYKDEVNL